MLFISQLFVGLLCVFGGSLLFAQDIVPEVVTFTPLIDFTSLFTGLLETVAPVVAGAIGVGLAIWGTRWLYQRAKSLAR
jgi:hypothetical protein